MTDLNAASTQFQTGGRDPLAAYARLAPRPTCIEDTGLSRQLLSDLVQRVHTADELQNVPSAASANSAQPFSVPHPVTRTQQ